MVNKSTTEEYRTELFAPIMKGKDGKYMAVLSDNSVDRDDERVSSDCIRKMGMDDGYLAALCNHDNDVFMQVAEWTNRGVHQVGEFTTLVAEPKFYKSNPKSQILKGMLDEGAKFGVSIGVIVKNYDEVNGMKVFTDLELLEASFVAVPSNRHGRAMAVAKSYNKNQEVMNMDKEFTQKDLDLAVEKKNDELVSVHKKELESKNEELVKIKEDLEKANSMKKEAEEAAEEAKEKAEVAEEEAEKKVKDAKEAVQKAKDTALEKLKMNEQGGDGVSSEDTDKAFKEGKLPVMRLER